jgi:hypothetical protein
MSLSFLNIRSAEGSTVALSSSLRAAEQWVQACTQGLLPKQDSSEAHAFSTKVFPRLRLRVNMHEALAALEQPDSASMQAANTHLKQYACPCSQISKFSESHCVLV